MRYTTRIIVPPRIRRSGPPGSLGGAYGPQVIGVRKTFGFGDRLGLATAAHLAAAATHPEFAPMFAQQSVQEMALTARTPGEVLGSAARTISAARLRQPWGADADRLHTAQQVADAAEAGFTCFTFDPSELVPANVDTLGAAELQSAIDAFVAAGDLTDHWSEPYLDRTIDLPGGHRLRISLEPLQRAVVRYLPAVVHCARLSSALARSSQGRPFEIEVALDQVDSVATALEHLFIGLELEARGVRLTGLALRHARDFGADEPSAALLEGYEQALREHAAVAEFCGPYKLCFYEEAIVRAFYPVIGRVCGEGLHVKSSAASYLEALRVVQQVNPGWFDEVVRSSVGSAAEDARPESPRFTAPEAADLHRKLAAYGAAALLDDPAGRRCLDAACGVLLTSGQDSGGRPFRSALLELLAQYPDLYAQAIGAWFDQQVGWLGAG